MNKVNSKKIIKWAFLIIIMVAVILIVLYRQWIYDFARGKFYHPTAEMVTIRDGLNLTDKGEFLFNATWPTLNTREEFNDHCRMNNEEIAILGCYTGGNIYVYNIVEDELKGIRELTTAHELLHVNFARMSDGEKESLRASLEKVYTDNEEILKKDLDTYDEAEKFEELYVRAGTEVKSLPANLEKHFAELFKDQDKIVNYYNSYIGVFTELETEFETLTSEMETISGDIETKTEDYEKRVAQLNADIVSFNSCANVTGCFKSQGEFYEKRSVLVNEQNALDALYDEINELVEQYNIRVEKYNKDVLWSEKLNQMINSSAKPQEIE